MKKYIDKAAVVAEIEDWRDKIKNGIFSIPLMGRDRADAAFEYEILGKVRDFLDTFEVKEVSEHNDVDMNPIFEEIGVDPDSHIASLFKNAFYKAVDRYLEKKRELERLKKKYES